MVFCRCRSAPSRLVLTGVVASLSLAGCGSGSKVGASATRSSAAATSLPPSTQESSDETAALAAYSGMWSDVQRAALTANYRSPLLDEHATGNALSVLARGLYSLQLQHLVIKGAPVLHPTVTSLKPTADPTTATIRDCFDDTHWLNYKAAGGLQDKVPGGHRLVTATLSHAGGAWKVTQLNTGAEGTC